jgi:hypothetical protein
LQKLCARRDPSIDVAGKLDHAIVEVEVEFALLIRRAK